MNGVSLPSLERLYPAINFPVSRGTQMISPLILWDHSEDHFTGEYNEKTTQVTCERKIVVNIGNEDTSYMKGHIIDGRLYSFGKTVKIVIIENSENSFQGVAFCQLQRTYTLCENLSF